MRINLSNSSVPLCALLFVFCFLASFNLSAQPSSSLIKGVVQNTNSEPLAGVSVIIRNLKTNFTSGTSSDSLGGFTFSRISAGGPYSFTFSNVGYETQTLSGYNIKENSTLSLVVKLSSTMASLDQVVVVGYGTQKRKDLTGAVGSVASKDIKDLAVTRIDQALLGKAAGVQVKPSTGEPGAAPQIRIRGIGSISAGSGPLYVVDGFPTSTIETLNPNDIESIDILKDASATAIYGSRGSNGVIIINTKRGKAGKPTVSFDTYYGLQKVSKTPKFMTSMQQAQYFYDGVRNRNIDNGNNVSGPAAQWKLAVPQIIIDVLEGKNTTEVNALDEVLRTAPQQQYQLSLSGGTENVKYAVSGEYLDQDGLIITNSFKRYSLRTNFDAKVTKRLSVKINVNPSFIKRRGVNSFGVTTGAGSFSILGGATSVNPFYPIYNPDGSYFAYNGYPAVGNFYNPVALAKEVINKQNGFGLLGNISAEYTIFDDLKLNVLFGTTLSSTSASNFTPSLAAFFDQPAFGSEDNAMFSNWLTEYTLNYNKSTGKHNISALAGFTAQEETGKSSFVYSDKYPNNLVPSLSAVSGLVTNGSANEYDWSLVSYLARVNYNFNSKYYLTTSIRTDGSSRFGSDKKYGLFPSVALAWRVSDENFLKNVGFLSELKIRTSYGKTGNNNIGNYEQYGTINYYKYPLGGVPVAGFAPARLANPSLTWEKQQSVNAGVDVAFFKRRLMLTVDHFQSRNTDLLLNVNVADITGFSTALKNIGEVKNTGWEFVLSTVNLAKKIEWTTDFNFSAYKNKVVRLGPSGDPIISGGNITMIGQPIGMFYGWLTDGIFKSQAEVDKGPVFGPGTSARSRPGDLRFVDVSGPAGKPDGVINSFDKTIMGSPYPDFFYGMTNRFAYQNISLSVSLQGVHGNQILAESRRSTYSGRSRFRNAASQINYWKSEQEPGDGRTPRPNDAPTGNQRGEFSQNWLDKGTYLRINNITLGYLLAENISQKLGLKSFRVYLNATNPFLFTKNLGFNPDVNNNENALTPGRDLNDYPLPKSLILGLNVGF